MSAHREQNLNLPKKRIDGPIFSKAVSKTFAIAVHIAKKIFVVHDS